VAGDEGYFRDEVRTTFLHELGHYLGLDEDELAVRGLE
jgi:predicted Zn-dependent protease with MMP-like domain